MRITTRAIALASLSLLALAAFAPARADISITLGNTPGGDNVLFNNNPPDGNTVAGVLNQNSIDFNVLFHDATQTLHADGGQARIMAAGGGNLTSPVDVSLDTGQGFTQYVANPFDLDTATMTITAFAVDAFGNPEAPVSATLAGGNGNNFFTVAATNGEVIFKVTISDASYTDLRQNRVAGAGDLPVPPSSVPEPGTMAMFGGFGLSGALALLRKRRA